MSATSASVGGGISVFASPLSRLAAPLRSRRNLILTSASVAGGVSVFASPVMGSTKSSSRGWRGLSSCLMDSTIALTRASLSVTDSLCASRLNGSQGICGIWDSFIFIF